MFNSLAIFNGIVPLFPAFGSILSILLTLPALRLVDSCGRKRLLLRTLVLCALANYMLWFFSVILRVFGELNAPDL